MITSPATIGVACRPILAGYRIDRLVGLLLEIDHPVRPEVRHRTARRGVERDQPVAGGDVDDPGRLAVGLPVREAAAGQLPRRGGAARPLVEAVHPEHLAGRRVERHHRLARPAGRIHHAVDHQRRRLEAVLRHGAEVVRLEPPRHFQIAEVLRGDLIERRVAGVAEIAAVGAPFAAGRAVLRRRRRHHRQTERHRTD